MSTPGNLRGRVTAMVQSAWFTRAIAGLILLNAVTLGLETDPGIMAEAGTLLIVIDRAIVAVFVVELLLKLFAYRIDFFRNGWNIFDLLVVSIALIPTAGPLSVLRALRILRVLRLLSVVPRLRSVVDALLGAIPGMASIIAVLALIFYVGAVLATMLFGQLDHPLDPDDNMQAWFGSVGESMYTLFQVMTLESWSMGIVRPTMELYPWAWAFFVPFIVLTSFAVLNLFIGIIVDSMQREHQAEAEESRAQIRASAHEEAAALGEELRALRSEIAALRAAVERNGAPPPGTAGA